MDARRVLPFIVGLVVLAFALGSLPRSQPGGSLLFRSVWLLYLIYLGPVVALGITIALIVIVAMNWRDISSAIGFNMAKQRKARKKRSRWVTYVTFFFWAVAIGILFTRKGTIFNPTVATNSAVEKILGTNPTYPSPTQFAGNLATLSNFIDSSWFGLVLLGLVIIASFVLVQSMRAALKEIRTMKMQVIEGNQFQGLQAVQEAIRLVANQSRDPRSRIIACYQHLITTAIRLGAPISSYLTARELDGALKGTFELKGSASSDLTRLFEEARYSLHEIVEDDADRAQGCLESIARELNVELNN